MLCVWHVSIRLCYNHTWWCYTHADCMIHICTENIHITYVLITTHIYIYIYIYTEKYTHNVHTYEYWENPSILLLESGNVVTDIFKVVQTTATSKQHPGKGRPWRRAHTHTDTHTDCTDAMFQVKVPHRAWLGRAGQGAHTMHRCHVTSLWCGRVCTESPQERRSGRASCAFVALTYHRSLE